MLSVGSTSQLIGWEVLSVASKLVHYVEVNGIAKPVENGLNKIKIYWPYTVGTESFIREVFIRKQHTVVIFFDLRKSLRYNI